MENEIKTIPLLRGLTALECVSPDPRSAFVSEHDAAVEVMTDFRKVMPITVEPIVSIDLALRKMKDSGVRLLLVTDEHDQIAGTITSYDIQGEKPVKYAEENKIDHTAILVHMIMTRMDKTPCFDFDFVEQALVRHVIQTLRELDRQHALVIEEDKRNRQIRGMFSSTQIGKLLGKIILDPMHAGSSLAEIQHDISHTI